MSEPLRRRVTYGQLEHLWEFLDKRRDIALGFNKSSQAREFSRRMWEEIALSLNSHGDGAVKDWKGWCKYWNDNKCKLKKLAAASNASLHQTGGGRATVKPMSDIELKFLQILGADFGSGLPGVRVEPFDDEEIEINFAIPPEVQNQSVPINSGGSESILTAVAPGYYDVQEGPSWSVPTLPSRPQSTPVASPNPQPSPHRSPRRPYTQRTPPSVILPGSRTPTITPRRSPRRRLLPPPSPQPQPPPTERRRRLRREPPISMEKARHALIAESQKQTKIQEEKLKLFQVFIDEIREIKEIIKSRSNDGIPGDAE